MKKTKFVAPLRTRRILRSQQKAHCSRENKARGNSFSGAAAAGTAAAEGARIEIGSLRNDKRSRSSARNLLRAWSRAIQIEVATGDSSRTRVRLALKDVSHYIFRDDLRHFYGKTSIRADPVSRRAEAAASLFSRSRPRRDHRWFFLNVLVEI